MDETIASTKPLAAGETLTLTKALIAEYLPRSAEITISASQLAGIDPARYIKSLRKYPYGCTEQTVSKAMPLLFAKSLGGLGDMSDDLLTERIERAIQKLSSRQSITGEFGLWRQNDGNLTPWLQLYVSEFLVEAKREGYTVSDQSYENALSAARTLSQLDSNASLRLSFPSTDSRRAAELQQAQRSAYAHYVLAIANEPNASGIRYLNKAFGNKFTDPIAMSYLGSALSKIGDDKAASEMFESAYETLGEDKTYNYYSSPERDAAALLAVGGAALEDELTEKLLLGLSDLDPAQTSTS